MTQRIAVITGATGGIGRQIVADLARDHHVYALGRNEEKLAELAALPQVTTVACDLVKDLLDDGAIPTELAELTRVDVLVNAAAIADRSTIEDSTPTRWRTMFDTNVTVPAELTRLLLPALRAAEGLAVFINSGAGRGAHPGNAIYAATKHALYAVTDALRKEQANEGVRVTTVAPGPVNTPMLQGLNAAANQEYTPERYIVPTEVAAAVRTAVAAGPTAQITDISVRPRVELADLKK